MNYVEPLFRPPSEARSLILQVTNGCSWNRCTFCEMYTAPQKKFSVKPQSEIEQELQQVASSGYPVRRVFLADGDAIRVGYGGANGQPYRSVGTELIRRGIFQPHQVCLLYTSPSPRD